MTAPTPTPTQVRHPWRAVARTAAAVLVALAVVAPEVLAGLHLDTTVVGAQVLVVAGGITRVLALPGVEAFLGRWLPWLAASPE